VFRVGFGAMQLPGPGVFGPPRDRDAAIAVLRRAADLGVDHIDTAYFYGPEVANELIRTALHPYPDWRYFPFRRTDPRAWVRGARLVVYMCRLLA
jgi:aryl-alcohol dehydrogenase-like predicted oxidoreductase